MSDPSSNWKARWRESGFWSCAKLLISVVAILAAILLPISLWSEGIQGSIAMGLAAVICLASGLTALLITSLRVPGLNAYHGVLLAMGFRLFPPLAVCLLLALNGSGAEYLGFICYLLVFYMVTLFTETYLSIRGFRTQTG